MATGSAANTASQQPSSREAARRMGERRRIVDKQTRERPASWQKFAAIRKRKRKRKAGAGGARLVQSSRVSLSRPIYPATTAECTGGTVGRHHARRWSTMTPSAVGAGIAVVTVDHATAKDRAENPAEDRAATLTAAGIGTAAIAAARPLAARRNRRHRRRPRYGRSNRI